MAGLTVDEKVALLKQKQQEASGPKQRGEKPKGGPNSGSGEGKPKPGNNGPKIEIKAKTNKYDEVSAINTGKLSSLIWKDSEISKVHVYRVSRSSSVQCIALGKTLVTSIISGLINSSIGDVCLALAVSLGQPGVSGFHHLLEPIEENLGTTVSFNQPDGPRSPQGLTATDKAKLSTSKKKLKEATEEADKQRYQDIIDRLTKQENGEASGSGEPPANEQDASAYCYLAAYLFRLAGRDEASFHDSLQTMVLRYAAWYDGDTAVLTGFKPTVEAMKALRMVFNRRPELLSTWVMTVAYNENKTDHLPQTHQGLLNYLACQQYAYTGMHAYKLILDIHEATGIKYSDLLSGFDCPITRSGIHEVLRLIRDHEITTGHSDRKTYFRYARVWNPKYFSALQSSNCKTLVYVAARVTKMTGAQKSGGDPTEIQAIKNLDKVMKDRLDIVAERMSHAILDSMLNDDESGAAWV